MTRIAVALFMELWTSCLLKDDGLIATLQHAYAKLGMDQPRWHSDASFTVYGLFNEASQTISASELVVLQSLTVGVPTLLNINDLQ